MTNNVNTNIEDVVKEYFDESEYCDIPTPDEVVALYKDIQLYITLTADDDNIIEPYTAEQLMTAINHEIESRQ